MSQVKKLQQGGSLTIDGIRYDTTPELINQLSQYLNSYGNTSAPIAGLISDLQAGANVNYNSVGNRISGLTQERSGVDQETFNKRASTEKRSRLATILGNDQVQFDKAVNLLKGFRYFDPKSAAQNNTSKQTDIFGNRLFYKYGEAGENGKRKLVADSPENSLISSRLNTFADWLAADENGRKNYKLDSWYNPTNLAAINALYGQYGNNSDAWKARLQQIATNAANDSLTESDLALLKAFNVVEDNEDGTSTSSTGLTAKDRTAWKNAGYTDDIINALAGKATLDKNGVLRMNEGEDWGLGNWATDNLYFNDNFYKYTEPGTSGNLNFLKNYTLYNGGLYNRDKIKAILNLPDGYNALKKSGKWSEAEKLIRAYYRPDLEDPGILDEYSYSPFLSQPGYRFSHITGLRGLSQEAKLRLGISDSDLDQYQLVQYVNLNHPDENAEDPYNAYAYKFALLDKNGRLKYELNNNDLLDIQDGKAPGKLETYRRVKHGRQTDYRNMYREDFYNRGIKDSGFTLYRDINDPNGNVIIHMPSISATGTDGMNLRIPKEVAQQLMPILSNSQVMERILGNAQNKENFIDLLSHLVQAAWARNGWGGSGIKGTAESQYLTVPSLLRDTWGIDGTAAEKLYNAIARYGESGDADTRKAALLVPELEEIEEEKNGGILKHQEGGIAGGNKESIGVTQRDVNADYVNPKNAAIIGKGTKNWTQADDLDLAALLGDVASLGFAFVPGANIGSAVAGFGSSITRHIADTKRGDANVLNLGLNLLMDAATLLPVIGGGVKTIKTANAFRKFLPTIIKAASIYGLGDAVVTSAKKIASGEGWTVRDVSRVVNGLTAGIGVKRSGGLKKSTDKVVMLKGKNGNKDITLRSDKVKNIKSAEDISNTFYAEAKKSNPNLTFEEFSKNYDVEGLLTTRNAWKPGLNIKKWLNTAPQSKFKFKDKAVKAEYTKTGDSWKDWMHGVSDENKLWRNTVLGETEPITITRSLKRTYTPKTIKFKGKDIQFAPEEIAQIVSRKDINKLLMSKLPKDSSKQDLIELYMEFNKQKNQTKLVRNSSGKVPDRYKRVGPIRKSKQKGLGIKVGDVYNISADYKPWMGLALPQWVAPAQTNATDKQPNGAVLRPIYKKGGVVKAQNSTPGGLRSGLDLSGLDLTFTNKKKDNSLFGFNATIGTGTNFGSYIIADKDGKVRRIDNNPIGSLDFTPEPYSGLVQNPTSVIQNDTNPELGNTVSEFQKEKDWTPAANTLNYLKTKNDVKKTVDNITSVPAYTMQGYNPSAPRFVLSGLGNQYRDAARKMKLIKQVTSDQNIANADIRQRMAQVNDYYLKGAMQDSKEWSAYQTGLSDFVNKVYGKNWDIAAQNGYSWNSKLMRDAQARNAGISEISKHRNNWVYSMLDQYNRARLNRDRTNALKYDFDVFGVTRSELNNKANDLLTKYGGDTENPGYKFEMENLRRQAENLQLQTMNNMSLFKSGGKVSKSSGGKNSKVTYSRDPYPDLLLQESKNSDKKVEKINDAIIKLILQTKPIHVS